MAQPRHVFETYIRATPERIWDALTDPDLTARYFFDSRVASTWDVGAPYRFEVDGRGPVITGEILECDPPKRLVMSFRALFADPSGEEPASRVTWEIAPVGDVCRVTCVHTDLFGAPKTWAATADGWNVILNGLKTLLETGEPLGEVADDGGSPFTSDAPPETQWHRALAVECNNGTYDLLQKDDRTEADAEAMVDMAHAAKHHWSKVGDAVNQVRADYLCARVYAFLGRSEPALHHAERALARAIELGLDDFDLAFVHEGLARSRACGGDARGAATEIAAARAVPIADPEDKAIVDADLAAGPWYGVEIGELGAP